MKCGEGLQHEWKEGSVQWASGLVSLEDKVRSGGWGT